MRKEREGRRTAHHMELSLSFVFKKVLYQELEYNFFKLPQKLSFSKERRR